MYYIYRITNLINGKTYIGQHKYEDLYDSYMGKGKHLLAAQKKYGIKNFKKDILVFNISKREYADSLEETFIAAEREKVGIENCYNITNGGEGYPIGHHSEETKEKMKKSWVYEKHITESWRRKQSERNSGKNNPMYGRHWKLVEGKRVYY